ncbi:MAG: cyanophycin synthetase [Patescibacteria group bacterium]
MTLLGYQNFYLVGIKGVAMTALAQCLLDAGKNISGSDVKEEFVTQKILNDRNIKIDIGFEHDIPQNIDVLIYTAAHGGPDNPLVKQAKTKNIPTLSHAQALAKLFNDKKGIAVSGVGGKSTVSAMITWILEKTKTPSSFAVGVGDIIGLNKTGQWNEKSEYFVAEADEYVVDPAAREKGEEIIARFSYLKPHIAICTNLKFDHPDVYDNFDHTKKIFTKFFENIKPEGYLLINKHDQELINLAKKIKHLRADIKIQKYSLDELDIQLNVPGKFNMLNAQVAVKACLLMGIDKKEAIAAIKSFQSTRRRFEFIGEKNRVKYYDDYAHHPDEIKAVIQTLNNLYPKRRIVYAFQSHTFSRTKKLFSGFVDSFAKAKEVVMIDIFASAREKADSSISSDLLCQRIKEKYLSIKTKNLKNIDNLAKYCQKDLHEGDILITLGAGDIYQVHDRI